MNIRNYPPDSQEQDTDSSSGWPSLRRRHLLESIGIAVSTGFAGCLGGSPTDGTSTANPTTPSTPESLSLPSVVTRGNFPDRRVELRPEGTVTLLNFFATWCKPCQEEMPDFRRLRAEYDSDTLHMVSITPEVDDELIKEFWSKYNGTWPVVKDPALKATKKWNANSYPTNLLFDRTGGPAVGDSPKISARDFSGLKSLIDPLVEESQ